jgi:hypothetical protein
MTDRSVVGPAASSREGLLVTRCGGRRGGKNPAAIETLVLAAHADFQRPRSGQRSRPQPSDRERISYLALKIMLVFYLTPKIKIFPICPPIEFSFCI